MNMNMRRTSNKRTKRIRRVKRGGNGNGLLGNLKTKYLVAKFNAKEKANSLKENTKNYTNKVLDNVTGLFGSKKEEPQSLNQFGGLKRTRKNKKTLKKRGGKRRTHNRSRK
jgi:hypothetical protein